jgi:D-alanyl-D-alanine dipeptidase
VKRAAAVAALAAAVLACSGERAPERAPARESGAAVAAGASGAVAAAAAIPAATRQLIVAKVDDWDDVTAELARFERTAGGAWRQVGRAWPAVIGARGSAWGRGLHGPGAPTGRTGPEKREGDGKSPAGLFALGGSFGYAPRPPGGARAPYTQVDDGWVCVDDARSSHYNAVLDGDGVAADWSSTEVMRRRDDLYRWVVVVEHNREAAPGAGSCIFLHVWRGSGSGTAGCTAMERADIEAVLAWLDPAARPVFALLPSGEYAGLRSAWGLP